MKFFADLRKDAVALPKGGIFHSEVTLNDICGRSMKAMGIVNPYGGCGERH
jgi:hypothetical protein